MPIFLYGCEVYSGCSIGTFTRVRKCFNAVIRFVYGLRGRDHVSEWVCDFLGCDLSTFLKFRSVVFLGKTILARSPEFLVEKVEFLRSQRGRWIKLPRRSHVIMDRSFRVRTARLWNNLPLKIHSSRSVAEFKRECFKVLSQQS